jgi:hypothetical protein
MHRTLLLLSALAVPFAACGTTSRLIEDNVTSPRAIATVGLGEVRFDYSRWANRDENELTTARQNEAAWQKIIGDAFLARATRHGMTGGENRTLVDITVVELDPGNTTQRSGVGIGDGTGRVSAVVEPRGHGSFRLDSEIGVGAWGGDFTKVLEKLGTEAADHLAKLTGR